MLETGRSKVVVLDGGPGDDGAFARTRAVLLEVLNQDRAAVQIFSLSSMKLAHCIGCFGCWTETPGLCRYQEAGGVAILESALHSDTVIVITPVTFGGYSAQTKQIVDRFAPLILPYLALKRGEVHHRPRYAHYPRWLAIGVQAQPNAEDARLFTLLAGRNAINFQAPSYAADVLSSADTPDHLRAAFRSLLVRNDPFPWAEAIQPLTPLPDQLVDWEGGRHATLIVGSPKTLTPSTSGVLGHYLLERLQERGWETESLTLTSTITRPAGQAQLLAAVDRADLLVFAFPLYVDALPFLMTRTLEIVAEHRHRSAQVRPQRLVAIANNGFPEAYQNHLALSICRRFAAATGMTWAGGLALGGGEGLIGGQPLQARSASGLPAVHVIRALDMAAVALAGRKAVPPAAIQEMARSPIPHMPDWLWHRMFLHFAARWWEQQAAPHGVSKAAMLAQPYALENHGEELTRHA